MIKQEPSDLLHRLPKAELHVHLDGSLRPETMLELAREQGKPMPADDAEALREYMHVRDARNLVDYLARFEITLSVMQTADALERIAYELAEDLAGENVRYAEIRYSPILNAREGLPLTETVDAPLRGLRRAEEEFGIRTVTDHLRHPQHGPGDVARPGGPDRRVQEPRRRRVRPGRRRVQLPREEAQGRLLHRHQQEHGGDDPRG